MSQARDLVVGSISARFRSAAYALAWFTSSLLMTSAAWAQDGRTIAGRVVDTSDAVIVGAEVTVTDKLGASLRMVTDERGEFRVFGLAAGDYIVQVERAQFRRSVVTVHLGTDDSGNALRVVLRAAGVRQVTVISRSAPYAEPRRRQPACGHFAASCQLGVTLTRRTDGRPERGEQLGGAVTDPGVTAIP